MEKERNRETTGTGTRQRIPRNPTSGSSYSRFLFPFASPSLPLFIDCLLFYEKRIGGKGEGSERQRTPKDIDSGAASQVDNSLWLPWSFGVLCLPFLFHLPSFSYSNC